jgi:hypothetical protein
MANTRKLKKVLWGCICFTGATIALPLQTYGNDYTLFAATNLYVQKIWVAVTNPPGTSPTADGGIVGTYSALSAPPYTSVSPGGRKLVKFYVPGSNRTKTEQRYVFELNRFDTVVAQTKATSPGGVVSCFN